MNKIFCLLAAAVLVASSAWAEDINLVADEKVEWYQNENKMVAVGNAVASKKDLSVRGDTITAYYDSVKAPGGEKAKSRIKTVHARGGVIMKSPRATGFGDTLDYDVVKDTMFLNGRPAKIKTAEETITSTGGITYYLTEQKAVATGEVIASDKENKIYSDKMVSYFTKNAEGNLEMERVEIFGHVKIVTPTAVANSERGIYLPKEAKVRLFDDVVLNQDGSLLKGDYAETDLNTGISRMLMKKGSGKRVSGVFKEKKKENKPTTAAPDAEKDTDNDKQ